MNPTNTNMFGVPIAPIKSPLPPQETFTEVPEEKKSAAKKIFSVLIFLTLTLISLFFFYVAFVISQEKGIVSAVIPTLIGIVIASGVLIYLKRS